MPNVTVYHCAECNGASWSVVVDKIKDVVYIRCRKCKKLLDVTNGFHIWK